MNSYARVRRLFIVLPLAASLILGVTATGVLAAPAPTEVPAPRADSPSVVVMDAVSGKVLFEKDATLKRNPASVTKVMTLVLALEEIGRAHV